MAKKKIPSPKISRPAGKIKKLKRKKKYPKTPVQKKEEKLIKVTHKPQKQPIPTKKLPKTAKRFDKTQGFKNFNKKFLKKADKEYKKQIIEFWEQQYKKGIPLKQVRKQTSDRYIYDTRNRFYKSRKPYLGKTAFKKNEKGEWVGGKPKKRYMWRDKLTGKWLKGRKVALAILKALEPFHVRNYMQKHKIKKYQKARKKYLKETQNKSLGEIVQLYGIYLH